MSKITVGTKYKSNLSNRLSLALKIALLVAFIITIAPLVEDIANKLIPVIQNVMRGGDPQAIKLQLRSFGWQGVVVMILLQVFQNMTIIIPAPVVWVISGITYGLFGVLICLIGTAIANAMAFSLSKKHGSKLIKRIVGKKNAENNFFARSKHPAILVALVYILPGLPNGIIPYLAGVTKISLKQFVIVSTLSILPSLLCFIYIGDNLLGGNMTVVITLGVIIAVISVFCFIFRKKLIAKLEEIANRNEKKKALKQMNI